MSSAPLQVSNEFTWLGFEFYLVLHRVLSSRQNQALSTLWASLWLSPFCNVNHTIPSSAHAPTPALLGRLTETSCLPSRNTYWSVLVFVFLAVWKVSWGERGGISHFVAGSILYIRHSWTVPWMNDASKKRKEKEQKETVKPCLEIFLKRKNQRARSSPLAHQTAPEETWIYSVFCEFPMKPWACFLV